MAYWRFNFRALAMKDAFPGHFANDPQDLQRLWEGSLIAVDANVLLSLYRYSDGTRNEFLELFEKLKDRLWVPHQVAKEYFKNRLKVISDQAKTYDAAIQGLEGLRKNFENPKQHPFVSAEVLGDCIRSFEMIIGELQRNKERHDKKINDDDVKDSVSRIFQGKVGAPFTAEQLESIIGKGEARYADKIPPGFKDADKAGGSSLEDRLAPYGDYIGWLQLLDKAKEDGRDIIYVTGDNKEDWWLKQSGRTVGPLPALVDEFTAMTAQRFYMYLPDRFLERAGQFLQQEVSAQAMDEAREVRLDEPDNSDLDTDHVVESAGQNLNRFIAKATKLAAFLDASGGRIYPSGASVVHRSPKYLVRLHRRAKELNRQMVELSAEIDQRMVGDPTEQFIDFSDDQLERLQEQTRTELTSVLRMIESFDAARILEEKS